MRENTPTVGNHGAFIVDRHENILAFDQGMETLTGWPSVDIVGRKKTQPVGRGGFPVTLPLYDGVLDVGRTGPVELTLHCADGSRVQVGAVADPLPGPGDRLKITALEVLSRSSAAIPDVTGDALDILTGLPSGETFSRQLDTAFRTAAEAARPLALVLADVDRLRKINDRYGRQVGDRLLAGLGGVLRATVGDGPFLCRLADDDFAILMPGAGRGEARQLAAAIRSAVESHWFFSDDDHHPEIPVTLSLGAASFPADADSPGDLLERARDALEEARSMGRNRVWCYLRRPRVPVQVPVFFDGTESLLVGYTRDLSPSGVFVQTAAPMEIGMRCALAFPLPGYGGRVHVIGHVVRTVAVETPDLPGAVPIPGMGIEFQRFGGNSDRRAIEAFLHENERLTVRPENGTLSVSP